MTASVFWALAVVCTAPESKQTAHDSPSASYRIDTVRMPMQHFQDICFQIDSSEYLKITGDDKAFAKLMSEIFEQNFNSFVAKAKAEHEGCPDIPMSDPLYNMLSIPASVKSNCEILSYNPRLISVIQNFVSIVGGGGNGFSVEAKVLNFDLVERKPLTNQDFGITEAKVPLIEQRIKAYFDNLFDDGQTNINYPVIDAEKLDELQFGIRNDSLLPVIGAYPTSHASYGIYRIPIEKYKSL